MFANEIEVRELNNDKYITANEFLKEIFWTLSKNPNIQQDDLPYKILIINLLYPIFYLNKNNAVVTDQLFDLIIECMEELQKKYDNNILLILDDDSFKYHMEILGEMAANLHSTYSQKLHPEIISKYVEPFLNEKQNSWQVFPFNVVDIAEEKIISWLQNEWKYDIINISLNQLSFLYNKLEIKENKVAFEKTLYDKIRDSVIHGINNPYIPLNSPIISLLPKFIDIWPHVFSEKNIKDMIDVHLVLNKLNIIIGKIDYYGLDDSCNALLNATTLCSLLIRFNYFSMKPDPKSMDIIPWLYQLFSVGLKQETEINSNFITFYQTFIKVNNQSDQRNQRNPLIFFTIHLNKILQLITIAGIPAIHYLKKQLAHTVLTLERTLENIPMLPHDAQNLFIQYLQRTDNQRNNNKPTLYIRELCLCLQAVDCLNKVDQEKLRECLTTEQPLIDQSIETTPLGALLNRLVNLLILRLFPDINCLNQQEINKLLQWIEVKNFIFLVAASQRMQSEELQGIFMSLLKCDLFQLSVDNYLHNTQQSDDLGQQLAWHNAAIRTKLKNKHISSSESLNYQQSFDFVIFPDSSINITQDDMYLVLWSYIENLKNPTDNFLKICTIQKQCAQLKKILTQITTLKNKINQLKDHDKKLIQLKKQETQQSICIIIRNLEQFNNIETVPVDFKEFSQHVQMHWKEINNLSNAKGNKAELQPAYFKVMLWPKNNPFTFALGDDVGCCLAMTGSQFQAMVQRRADDAFLFPVAVDLKTGKPVALIWLYLAETINNEVVLVANFFEVNTKYAKDATFRMGLLNGLLSFVQNYCEANPNIRGFYMNPLNYGWNMHDLKDYPLNNLQLIDKLGGAFISQINIHSSTANAYKDEENQKELTQMHYYLSSLNSTQFHQFDSNILSKKKTQYKIFTKQWLLEEAMINILSDKHQLPQESHNITILIAKHYNYLLKPFYDNVNNLTAHLPFKADIQNVIKHYTKKFKQAWQILQDLKPEINIQEKEIFQMLTSDKDDTAENLLLQLKTYANEHPKSWCAFIIDWLHKNSEAVLNQEVILAEEKKRNVEASAQNQLILGISGLSEVQSSVTSMYDQSDLGQPDFTK